MCGIAGLYHFSSTSSAIELQQHVKRMTDAIAHRGPDGEGVWQDADDPRIVLGQRRLAILDLSPLGKQPMVSASGRYVCSYNGEIYNYQTLEAELKFHGYSFKGRSDTEVFLAAVEHWGLNVALQKIIGMYATILWDRKLRIIHLFRDRMGKKPLYFGWAGKSLLFASELKAFHAVPSFKPVINAGSVQTYMRYGYMHPPHSIFKGVWQLPAATRIALKVDELEAGEDLQKLIETYWSLPRVIEQQKNRMAQKSDVEYIAEFDDLLSLCVKERMVSDVPLGAFLSGGVDSSAIVALMQKQSAAPIKTYCIGFEEEKFNEAPQARAVAQHLGTDHHELILNERDALNIVPHMADVYDEPFSDPSQIPTYLVAQFARRDVTVALSGDGGDEMLGGYNRHFMVPGIWSRLRLIPGPFRNAIAAMLTAMPEHKWDRFLARQNYQGEKIYRLAGLLKKRSGMDIYDYLLQSVTNYNDVVLHREDQALALHDAALDVKGLSFAERMMMRDTLSYLPNDVLVKVDRATMAHALEGRAPLLDKRVAEYVWGLPEAQKIRKGQGKWLLKRVLANYVPEELFMRKKAGFSVPIGAWLKGDLKDWAAELLDENKLEAQGILNAKTVQRLWQAHQNGSTQAGGALWTIIMFQAWHQRWIG